MRVHYATYSRALKCVLRSIDAVLALRPNTRSAAFDAPSSPARILVCNQAHLGDAVLATAVIPALCNAYPQAQIGFLVHPGSRQVVEGHPKVQWVHTVEHWHLNRADVSPWQRLRQHRFSTREAVRSIAAVNYQLAIDLHPHFPNSIPLLRRCGIECRVGWSSAGFGRWLDIAATDNGKPINILQRHAIILRLLGIRCDGSGLRPDLPISDDSSQAWQARARLSGIDNTSFVALHIGAHAAHRRWSAEQWAQVAGELAGHGHRVVLLGHGAAEVELGRQLARACPQAIDLCGELGWGELLAAIAACRLLISHDSAATHLAAAFDRPRICIATGIHDLRVWLHKNERSVVLTKPVACAPCGRIAGCATMDCIRGVASDTVVEAALLLVNQSDEQVRHPDSAIPP